MRDENQRKQPGGTRGDTCYHGLSRSWNVEVCWKEDDRQGDRSGNTGLFRGALKSSIPLCPPKRSLDTTTCERPRPVRRATRAVATLGPKTSLINAVSYTLFTIPSVIHNYTVLIMASKCPILSVAY